MDRIAVFFTRTRHFTSQKKSKEYFTVEYLDCEDLKHYIDFISKEQYEKIEELELEALEEVYVVYKIGQNRNLIFDHFER